MNSTLQHILTYISFSPAVVLFGFHKKVNKSLLFVEFYRLLTQIKFEWFIHHNQYLPLRTTLWHFSNLDNWIFFNFFPYLVFTIIIVSLFHFSSYFKGWEIKDIFFIMNITLLYICDWYPPRVLVSMRHVSTVPCVCLCTRHVDSFVTVLPNTLENYVK